MSNLQDLINLAKADGGKFFVLDEKGDAKLVIMSIEDYETMLLGKLKRQIVDVESINKQIIQAQLGEEIGDGQRSKISSGPGFNIETNNSNFVEPQIIIPINNTTQKRAAMPRVDLREEVIDPSFDFEGPKVEIDDL